MFCPQPFEQIEIYESGDVYTCCKIVNYGNYKKVRENIKLYSNLRKKILKF